MKSGRGTLLGIDTFRLRSTGGELLVRVDPIPTRLTPEARALAVRALEQLDFELESGEPRALATGQRLLTALTGDARMPLRQVGPSLTDEAFVRHLRSLLRNAFLSGRLVVQDRSVPSLGDRPAFDLPDPPPLPAARPEPGTQNYEVRFVDEVGRAISGIDAEFTAGGAQTRPTNAAGIALLDGVQATSAQVEIIDADALSSVLDPRWTKPRPGLPPKESNTQEIVFRGGPLGPFSLKAEVPNTVVIKPPLGKLFVERGTRPAAFGTPTAPIRSPGPSRSRARRTNRAACCTKTCSPGTTSSR